MQDYLDVYIRVWQIPSLNPVYGPVLVNQLSICASICTFNDSDVCKHFTRHPCLSSTIKSRETRTEDASHGDQGYCCTCKTWNNYHSSLNRDRKKLRFVFYTVLTSCVCEAPDLLAIHIRLIPDQPVDQTGPCGIPALVQPALDRRTDVHLGQAAQWRDGRQRGGRREEDPQQREVACSSGAQVVQLHKGSWDWNFVLHRLGRRRWRAECEKQVTEEVD